MSVLYKFQNSKLYSQLDCPDGTMTAETVKGEIAKRLHLDAGRLVLYLARTREPVATKQIEGGTKLIVLLLEK